MIRALLVSVLMFVATGLSIAPSSVYDFKVPGLDGKTIDLSQFRGKKLMIVNTASKCGYTPQYADLEKLYRQYQDKLVIVGFPSNDFAHQDPGTNAEISEFCTKNYGVTFPMAEKVDVIGDNIAPLFKYLTDEAHNMGVKDPVIGWNFTKFLLDENGKLIAVFPSKVRPTDDQITKYFN